MLHQSKAKRLSFSEPLLSILASTPCCSACACSKICFCTSLSLQLMLAKLVQPYHLKVFFSNKFVHASILDTLQNVCVTSVSTNNKLFTGLVGATKPKNDVRACLAVAKLLAEKAQGLQVAPEARLALLTVAGALVVPLRGCNL